MVDGQDGHNGRHVPEAVMEVFRLDHTNAIIHCLNIEGHAVKETHWRQEHAIVSLVQVHKTEFSTSRILLLSTYFYSICIENTYYCKICEFYIGS